MKDWNWQLWVSLCPLPSPLKTPKIKISKKWKKLLEISSFYTIVPIEVQFLRYGVRQTEFFVILGHFLPSYPPNKQENQNFKTMKKASWDVIILHMCTKNHNHMMYASWDMEYDRYTFLSFWAISCPFTPLFPPKVKIWKKHKKHLEILSYYTYVP